MSLKELANQIAEAFVRKSLEVSMSFVLTPLHLMQEIAAYSNPRLLVDRSQFRRNLANKGRGALIAYGTFQRDCAWVLVALHLGYRTSRCLSTLTPLYLCVESVCRRAEHLLRILHLNGWDPSPRMSAWQPLECESHVKGDHRKKIRKKMGKACVDGVAYTVSGFNFYFWGRV